MLPKQVGTTGEELKEAERDEVGEWGFRAIQKPCVKRNKNYLRRCSMRQHLLSSDVLTRSIIQKGSHEWRSV